MKFHTRVACAAAVLHAALTASAWASTPAPTPISQQSFVNALSGGDIAAYAKLNAGDSLAFATYRQNGTPELFIGPAPGVATQTAQLDWGQNSGFFTSFSLGYSHLSKLLTLTATSSNINGNPRSGSVSFLVTSTFSELYIGSTTVVAHSYARGRINSNQPITLDSNSWYLVRGVSSNSDFSLSASDVYFDGQTQVGDQGRFEFALGSPSAVPEVQTYGLIILGLGFLGAVFRRLV